MAYCRAKTRYAAIVDLQQFLERNRGRTYFLTFTEPARDLSKGELYWTKTEAEKRLWPFLDHLRRKTDEGKPVEFLVVWEMQKRGSWHPHILVNTWLDVMKVRPWMVARGWGQQMRFRFVNTSYVKQQNRGWTESEKAVVYYLTKYLTKANAPEPRKKYFGGNAKSSTVAFKWSPWAGNPLSYLWHHGLQVYREMKQMEGGQAPSQAELFHKKDLIVRLGVEATEWLEFDPWFHECFG